MFRASLCFSRTNIMNIKNDNILPSGYEGKLYGKVGDRYIDTGKTSQDWDQLQGDISVLNEDVSKDGGLFNLGWYLGWTPGNEDAVLDGDFTAKDLRAIACYMETFSLPTRRL